jgi:D-glycero-alpha-D-manno-heptose-7-phosphate kinase
MPSRSGLGSSSSFTVALIKAIYELKKKKISKYKIAEIAAKIEIDILKRSIGKQDHYASAFGSLNLIKYNKNEKVFVNRLNLSDNKQKKIDDNLILFFTGIRRDSNDILNYQNQNVENVKDILIKIRDLVLPFRKLIKGNNIDEIGNILTQSWKLKKSLSNKISSSKINKYFNIAFSNGALGGKILGAGGGGFLLFYVRKGKKKQLINSLKNLTQINFNFENDGVKIVYNDKLDY